MQKQLFAAFVLLLSLFLSLPAQAQIKISEVGLSGVDVQGASKWVELYNAGSEEIDVSQYYLCNFPQYPRISTMTVLEGSTTMAPGSFLVVAWPQLGDADGEVGLYTDDINFQDPTLMVDYMQYGTAAHVRESVAVAAGVWEAGAFVETPPAGKSIGFVNGLGEFGAAWRISNPSAGAQNAQLYQAILSGGNHVPANTSRAQGTVDAILDGSELVVSGNFANLESDFNIEIAGGAHIHSGIAGQNGGIEAVLTTELDPDNRGGAFTEENNTFELTEEQLGLLRARKLYVNIHSLDLGSGELRGQFLPASGESYKAFLSGSAQVPSNTSAGNGSIIAEIDGTTLTVTGSFANLSSEFNADIAGGSHIHAGLAGQNGGVEVFLTVTLGEGNISGTYEAVDNTFEITEEQAELIRQRGMYINIHSLGYPGGEIRGQLMGMTATPFLAELSGANSSPSTSSNGGGMVLAELSGNSLVVSGTFGNLNGEFDTEIAGGAHIHDGLFGQNGGVAIPIVATLDNGNQGGSFEAVGNTFELTDEQIDALQARANYVNLHTTFSAAGEIRGQLLPASSIPLRAVFSGRAETTPNSSSGIGGALIELAGDQMIVTGAFSALTSPYAAEIGSHIHAGGLGQDGGVEFALNPVLDGDNLGGAYNAVDNTFEVNEEQKSNLLGTLNYVNIHSEAYNGGEIRGQITPFKYRPFEAYLSFANEVIEDAGKGPQVVNTERVHLSDGSGAVLALLGDTTLMFSGSFSGLESDFNAEIAGGAHVHRAAANANGGIELMLTTALDEGNRSGVFATDMNTFTLSTEQKEALLDGQLYVNIHSTDIPSGELRGQVLSSGNSAPISPSIMTPEEAAAIVITGEPATPFQATWNGGDSNANAVFYTWQLAADEAFETLVLEAQTDAPEFNATFGDVATLLTEAGVNLDGTITLYHRAIATDGSLRTVGEGASVVLTRGTITSNDDEFALPGQFALDGNYPNPFNPVTTIQFDLPQAAEVTVQVFDVLGRNVLETASRQFAAGSSRSVQVDASTLASGTYVYRVIAVMASETRIQTSQLTVLK